MNTDLPELLSRILRATSVRMKFQAEAAIGLLYIGRFRILKREAMTTMTNKQMLKRPKLSNELLMQENARV